MLRNMRVSSRNVKLLRCDNVSADIRESISEWSQNPIEGALSCIAIKKKRKKEVVNTIEFYTILMIRYIYQPKVSFDQNLNILRYNINLRKSNQ